MPDEAEIREIVRRIVEGLEPDDAPSTTTKPTDQVNKPQVVTLSRNEKSRHRNSPFHACYLPISYQ